MNRPQDPIGARRHHATRDKVESATLLPRDAESSDTGLVDLAEATIRSDYSLIRAGLPEGSPITVLHVGDRQTWVASGNVSEPEAIIALAIGAQKTSDDFFRHNPPTPQELENAIMTVEDEVAPARAIIVDGTRLFTRDTALREIALIAGLTDQPTLTLSLETMERTFDRLAAVALGRPAAHEGLPSSTAFAATLLILREFMHHLKFSSLTVKS
jgi:exopolyphosphatase/pppGpp-phosphohydrolase